MSGNPDVAVADYRLPVVYSLSGRAEVDLSGATANISSTLCFSLHGRRAQGGKFLLRSELTGL